MPVILAPRTVGVMGSGTEEHEQDARLVGEVLVRVYASDNALIAQVPTSVRRLHSPNALREFVREVCGIDEA